MWWVCSNEGLRSAARREQQSAAPLCTGGRRHRSCMRRLRCRPISCYISAALVGLINGCSKACASIQNVQHAARQGVMHERKVGRQSRGPVRGVTMSGQASGAVFVQIKVGKTDATGGVPSYEMARLGKRSIIIRYCVILLGGRFGRRQTAAARPPAPVPSLLPGRISGLGERHLQQRSAGAGACTRACCARPPAARPVLQPAPPRPAPAPGMQHRPARSRIGRA